MKMKKKKVFWKRQKEFCRGKKVTRKRIPIKKNQTQKEESKCSKIIQKWMKQLIANFKLETHKNRVKKCEKWEIGLL